MTDFMELMTKRYSCRKYSDKPVEDEKIVSCINAARLAPSAMNAQAWHFYVVNEPAKSRSVAEMTQLCGLNTWDSKCPAFIIAVQDAGNVVANGVLGAIHKDFRQIDMGIATMAMVLQAEELGLGCCILGLFDEEKMKKTFRIPSNQKIMLVIALGYAAEGVHAGEKKRKSLEDVVSYL